MDAPLPFSSLEQASNVEKGGKEMRLISRATAIAAVSLVTALAVAGSASAGPGGQLRIEQAYYDGQLVTMFQPTLYSADHNGGVLGCFGLGPDFTGIDRPAPPMYVIFDPSATAATQDHCDGQPTVGNHEHVLSTVPGEPGYTGAWTLVILYEASYVDDGCLVTPTPSICNSYVSGERYDVNLATDPYTNAADVQAAIDAGTLVNETPEGIPPILIPVIRN